MSEFNVIIFLTDC